MVAEGEEVGFFIRAVPYRRSAGLHSAGKHIARKAKASAGLPDCCTPVCAVNDTRGLPARARLVVTSNMPRELRWPSIMVDSPSFSTEMDSMFSGSMENISRCTPSTIVTGVCPRSDSPISVLSLSPRRAGPWNVAYKYVYIKIIAGSGLRKPLTCCVYRPARRPG